MKKFLISTLIALPVVAALGLAISQPVSAIEIWNACDGQSDSAVCASSKTDSVSSTAKSLINLSLQAIGIVAVIMIIISGFKFITANGDMGKVTSARQTLLYSVIGIAVALLAWSIVNFIVDNV